ncbi:probable phospholipid-transporting ATPase IF [Copidosoma floridanum]|uniref:probable phospholipid-transporting ATPase IF n=1 Tax=Copidosoma floridanum TaxID=29053 RepID=UPI0006C95D09|nr:probable phospholipid-transporting ATPase IF [Copidosoma floridanum]
MADGSSVSADHRVIELEFKQKTINSLFPSNKITTRKYTLWNFLPKNLFEQFRRVGNFYFLVSSVIATVIESPVSPLTSWLPLLFVIFVSACKQGYEDLKRYRSDRRVNNLPVTVVRRSGVQEIRCKDIAVGDVVRVNRDDEVPCDLVILYSSVDTGRCYVTTSNLDGETNLKTLQVPKVLADLEDASDIVSTKGTITCQSPMAGLYRFEGRIQVSVKPPDGERVTRTGPLTIDNLLLRGATLKDTCYILGCAVYTGRDTKLSLNSNLKTRKSSLADSSINKFLLVFIVFLLAEVIFCTGMKIPTDKKAKWNHYFGDYTKDMLGSLTNNFFSFIVLLNYILPISLYVTLEMQKFLGSYLFNWDLKMYDESSDQPAQANTSDLNENLGQIEYLFSDKTGTLTENLMIFRRCFVDGYSYMENDCDGHLYLLPPDGRATDAQRIKNWTREVHLFMLAISVCHDAHIAPPSQKAKAKMLRTVFRESFRVKKHARINSSLMMDPDLPEYEAASIDEKSLVEAAARLGVIFLGEKNDDEIEVNLKGTIMRFEKLESLEFTSDRKRMSVVIQDPDGDVRLYCKGADSSLFPLIVEGKTEEAKTSVNDFSMRGLRTLVYGYKKLSPAEFVRHRDKMNEARQTIGAERKKRVEQAYANLETGLTLLGVSALEDRLQECVPETMERLQAAGIKIWVLTGDKAETAENIAFSCGHFKKGTVVMRMMNLPSAQSCFSTLTSFERKMKIEPCVQRGLLMDGASQAMALKTCPYLLRNVAMACDAVVCCRMSPLQKSQIVQLVKRSPSKPMTAAIGDGGNDVSMIKEAHVGLGIMGKEGRQAAMNADYAFARFMHLQRALLVHGHWYYLRVAVLTMYFFYKNVVFITPQLFFSFHNGFSGQLLKAVAVRNRDNNNTF